MGNKHAEREVIDVINPPDNPFLHIVVREYVAGKPLSYRYVDSLSGLSVIGGTADLTRGIENFTPMVRIELPFLPIKMKLSQVQPIDGKKVVKEIILGNAREIIRAVIPPVNVLALSHGSMWGLYPEELIRQVLQEYGLNSRPGSFPEVIGWGRKRIKVHGIELFSHNESF